MKEIIVKGKRFLDKLREDHISESAAECAYYMILSLVPFIIFFLTLIQFTIIDKDFLVQLIGQIVPKSMEKFVSEIIEEVYSKSLGTVFISLVVALWSSSRGFYALCKGLKNIYKLSEERSNIIIRLEGFFYTLFFVICIILVIILFVFGNRIHGFIVENFFAFGIITSIFLRIRIFFTIILLFFAFLLLYKFLPRHKMTFKSQVPGAIFSSVAWIITSYVFSIYVDIFKGFTNTYGSLTSIILVMMWVYVCMYIILLGAELNIFIKKYNRKIKDMI